MKSIFKNAAAVATIALLASCGGSTATEESAETTSTEATEAVAESVSTKYEVNAETSQVLWKGTMLGAHSHNGTLKFTSGSFTVTDGAVTGGEFVVDMTSINPTDDGYSEENPKENLIGHLSSGDFFDVENHPTAKLVLMEGGKGQLTVRGNTNDVQIKGLEGSESAGMAKGKANLVFDRTKFDVSFVHPVKEMVLSDDIELSIEVAGTAI